MPFVVDSRKTYLFTVRWGEERDTDDAEGRVVATSESRPDAAAIRAELPRFTGTIEQVPPRFSAIKIDGERAYDLARDGETVELAPRSGDNSPARTRRNARSRTMPCSRPNAAKAPMSARWRAILAALLGAFGHVSALRRSRVGPFGESDMISLEPLEVFVP